MRKCTVLVPYIVQKYVIMEVEKKIRGENHLTINLEKLQNF